jgi:LmbE family N-acetylglucosaminyl deacetylase
MSESNLTLLAVGAHPDDIEFGCGGALLVEAARGSTISLCVCSYGEAGTNGSPEEREGEAREAAKLLGATIQFLELGGDCRMEVSAPNNLAIARLIRTVRPDLLLSPTMGGEQHPDHLVVSQLCRNAARFARYGGLGELRDLPAHAIKHHFEYAITPGAEPHHEKTKVCVDISTVFERWVELMQCHASQLRTRRYVELQTARARLLGLTTGVEYAQALYPVDDFVVNDLAALPTSARLF